MHAIYEKIAIFINLVRNWTNKKWFIFIQNTMTLLFDLFRWLYLFLTLVLIILITRWASVLPSESITTLQQYIMPVYLVVSGILIWYVLSLMHHIPEDADDYYRQNISTTSYIQWIVIGIFLALMYVYIG